jgi:hypothetical protein
MSTVNFVTQNMNIAHNAIQDKISHIAITNDCMIFQEHKDSLLLSVR